MWVALRWLRTAYDGLLAHDLVAVLAVVDLVAAGRYAEGNELAAPPRAPASTRDPAQSADGHAGDPRGWAATVLVNLRNAFFITVDAFAAHLNVDDIACTNALLEETAGNVFPPWHAPRRSRKRPFASTGLLRRVQRPPPPRRAWAQPTWCRPSCAWSEPVPVVTAWANTGDYLCLEQKDSALHAEA